MLLIYRYERNDVFPSIYFGISAPVGMNGKIAAGKCVLANYSTLSGSVMPVRLAHSQNA